MSANLIPTPIQRFTDSNGNALVGGLLYSYAAGTTTPQVTYTDSTGGTPNTNPIVLDSRGQCAVWVDPTLAYKFILRDPGGVLQWSSDNVTGTTSLGDITSRSGSVITFTSGLTAVADSLTRFLGANGVVSASETDVYWRIPCAGTVSLLFTQTPGASAGNRVYTIRKNAADQLLTSSATGAATQSSDTVHSFAVLAGDRLTCKLVTSGGSDTVAHTATVLFAPAR